jgi:heme a synthase
MSQRPSQCIRANNPQRLQWRNRRETGLIGMSIRMMRTTAWLSARSEVHLAVRLWLWAVAGLVLVMVTVGGATRLTGSGLSITEWKPLMGAIPPLNPADWAEAFEKYRQIAQYKLVNKGMSLDAFKVIFWWEWGHRQLGRFIGLAYGLPFLLFAWLKWLPPKLIPRFAGLLVLGGMQGAMGWYMVQSGLTDRVDVSQYRLAAHLTLAAIIFAGLVWTALDLAPQSTRVHLQSLPPRAITVASLLVALVLGQIFLGALVAGMKAGLAHNTWPLMDGRVIPHGLLAMTPWWLNLFENAMTVQFNHRMAAYLLAGLALWQGMRVARHADAAAARASGWLVALTILVQIGFGIWTLLAGVPLWLGLVHQATAMAVLGVVVWHRHVLGRDQAND